MNTISVNKSEPHTFTKLTKKYLVYSLGLFLLTSCMEIEKISGPCLVFLVTGPGERERFYEIVEDIRRNKSTGVFTYRDEDGKLWSISLGTDGNYYSKSTEETPLLVDRIECGDQVYNERPRPDDDE